MNYQHNVYVGIPDELPENEVITIDQQQSKMGGSPNWLIYDKPDKLPNLKCNSCNSDLRFLLQLYSPQDFDHTYHRMIYIFICSKEECCDTIKGIYAFRMQLQTENEYFKYKRKSSVEIAEEEDLPELGKENLIPVYDEKNIITKLEWEIFTETITPQEAKEINKNNDDYSGLEALAFSKATDKDKKIDQEEVMVNLISLKLFKYI